MTDAQIKQCTIKIKALADVRKLAIEDTDSIINAFFANLNGESVPLLENMTEEEKKTFAKKEAELAAEPEKRKLDEVVDAQTEVPESKRSAL